MRAGRILDPSLWVLVGVNGYLVYHYYRHPEVFTTLLWLYWSQSVLLGVFTFFELLSINVSLPSELKSMSVTLQKGRAYFFLFHYGFFHAVYLYFIATMANSGPFQWHFYWSFLGAFACGQLITFVQHKIQQRTIKPDTGAIMLQPYLRVVPMHLTLMAPAILHLSYLGVFLIFKSVTDVVMYLWTRPGSTINNTAALAQQTMSNMN